MTPTALLGVATGLGSLAFLVAAFLPISRVYAMPGAQGKLDLINRSPWAWRTSQALFATGAPMTAAGLGLTVLLADLPWHPLLRCLPLVLLGAGATLWVRHTHLRTITPDAWTAGSLPRWHFPAYTLLTIAGTAVTGLAFLDTGPTWLALTLLIAPALFLIAFVAFRDLPPFLHYLPTLALAVEQIRGA